MCRIIPDDGAGQLNDGIVTATVHVCDDRSCALRAGLRGRAVAVSVPAGVDPVETCPQRPERIDPAEWVRDRFADPQPWLRPPTKNIINPDEYVNDSED